MREIVFRWMQELGIEKAQAYTNLTMLILLVVVSIALFFIIQVVFVSNLRKRLQRSHKPFFSILGNSKFLRNALMVLIFIVMQNLAREWFEDDGFKHVAILVMQIVNLLFVLMSLHNLISVVSQLASRSDRFSNFPLGGIEQTIKLIVSIAIFLLIISLVIGKSPAILLSGLGAMSAVLMLIFKDPIMGLVAGIQLSANNMLKIGDWLEMAKYNADGIVVQIGLTTVKVQNYDNTMTTIPTYALISDSFKNWRAMSESGGRRIKRAVMIDLQSIRFLTQEDVDYYEKSPFLADYIKDKRKELHTYNQAHHVDLSYGLNGRRLTNVGTFRAYLVHYLKHHPRLHHGMTTMVRQLEPTTQGLPLEIYCFTNTVAWVEYEGIQADIFDHVYSIAKEFDIKMYQESGGNDIINANVRLVDGPKDASALVQ